MNGEKVQVKTRTEVTLENSARQIVRAKLAIADLRRASYKQGEVEYHARRIAHYLETLDTEIAYCQTIVAEEIGRLG